MIPNPCAAMSWVRPIRFSSGHYSMTPLHNPPRRPFSPPYARPPATGDSASSSSSSLRWRSKSSGPYPWSDYAAKQPSSRLYSGFSSFGPHIRTRRTERRSPTRWAEPDKCGCRSGAIAGMILPDTYPRLVLPGPEKNLIAVPVGRLDRTRLGRIRRVAGSNWTQGPADAERLFP